MANAEYAGRPVRVSWLNLAYHWDRKSGEFGYCGVLVDKESGAHLWSCRHGHDRRTDATACAKAVLKGK